MTLVIRMGIYGLDTFKILFKTHTRNTCIHPLFKGAPHDTEAGSMQLI